MYFTENLEEENEESTCYVNTIPMTTSRTLAKK